MSFALEFDYLPDSVEVGKPFTVAVVSPAAAEGDDVVNVILRASANGADLSLERAEPTLLSCGEALFDDVVVTACTTAAITLSAAIVGDDGVPVEGTEIATDPITVTNASAGDQSSAAAPGRLADDDERDVVALLALAEGAMQSANATALRHNLQLLRSRLWGLPQNDAAFARAGGPVRILTLAALVAAQASGDRVSRATVVDETLDALAVVVELLDNPSGQAIPSCAGCRAAARPQDNTAVVQVGDDGPVFHSACLCCGACKGPLDRDPSTSDSTLGHAVQVGFDKLAAPDAKRLRGALEGTTDGPVPFLRNVTTKQPFHIHCIVARDPDSAARHAIEPLFVRSAAHAHNRWGDSLTTLDSPQGNAAAEQLGQTLKDTGLLDDDFVNDRVAKIGRRAKVAKLLGLAEAM